jgi:N-acetylneuraminate synthase
MKHGTELFFIADIAANHDGSLDRAKKLIDLAAQSGADAVKFQHFRASHIVSDVGFRELKDVRSHQTAWSKSVHEVYQDASVPWDWTEKLYSHANSAGVEFMSTPYDFDAVEHLDPFVKRYKVGSGDITWLELFDAILEKDKQVLFATGASSLTDVQAAVARVRISKNKAKHVVMQCNTNYTGVDDNLSHINLNVLDQYAEEFPDLLLGLSDHTSGDLTVLGAIAKGAKYIEKHFTDDTGRSGPDHVFSMDPNAWLEMVKASQLLTLALGDGLKKVEKNELETVVVQRRALRFIGELESGHVLGVGDVAILRPAPIGSLDPSNLQRVLGRTLVGHTYHHQLISMADFLEEK